MKMKILATLLSGAWISLSEFLRNELIFKSLWLEKYKELGVTFPSEMINNAMWGIWSFLIAGVIVFLSARLKFIETVTVGWLLAFAAMWIVAGNLNVLPIPLLVAAIPLSIFEVSIAALIAYKLNGKTILPKAKN